QERGIPAMSRLCGRERLRRPRVVRSQLSSRRERGSGCQQQREERECQRERRTALNAEAPTPRSHRTTVLGGGRREAPEGTAKMALPRVNAVAYHDAIPRSAAWLRENAAMAGGCALVAVTAVALWLESGVHVDEIARFVPYE